ncbi:putative inorganic phosphate cotransporter [Photinus pyralis]|uniref:putative inorganic phosphate cotransporter n=1 Tax=Photinus pyralis TaxID=7054 RepID=UPI001266F985|nr:putative inorganic phosphate cotransporter [Photinus pyralis]
MLWKKMNLVSWYGARHTQVLLLFVLLARVFAIRVHLSVAIVAMTTLNITENTEIPTYTWTDKSVMLSAYYWGYVVPQVIAGQLGQRYGPKWLITGASAVCVVFTCLIPTLAQFGSWAVMLCRVVQGFADGIAVPCCHAMLSKWAPTSEKSRLSTFVYAGGPLGMVISMPVTGWLSSTWMGWPSSFYAHGLVAFVWTVAWVTLGKNCPADHKGIDPVELKYIEQSIGTSQCVQMATPWRSIVVSLPVWAILVSTWGQVWGFATLLTNIPTYLAHVMDYDIAENGLLSAAPYLIFWLLSFVFGIGSDFIITRRILSTGATRKLVNSFGMYVPGACLLILALMSTFSLGNATITLFILFLAVGISAAFLSGYNVNHIDIAPNHAGTLMGLTTGLGNISAIIGPLLVQFLVTDQSDVKQWATVFYTSSAAYIIGNTFYLIFASGEIQPWNEEEKKLPK